MGPPDNGELELCTLIPRRDLVLSPVSEVHIVSQVKAKGTDVSLEPSPAACMMFL